MGAGGGSRGARAGAPPFTLHKAERCGWFVCTIIRNLLATCQISKLLNASLLAPKLSRLLVHAVWTRVCVRVYATFPVAATDVHSLPGFTAAHLSVWGSFQQHAQALSGSSLGISQAGQVQQPVTHNNSSSSSQSSGRTRSSRRWTSTPLSRAALCQPASMAVLMMRLLCMCLWPTRCRLRATRRVLTGRGVLMSTFQALTGLGGAAPTWLASFMSGSHCEHCGTTPPLIWRIACLWL